jgi:PAS domain S-box-containing protein
MTNGWSAPAKAAENSPSSSTVAKDTLSLDFELASLRAQLETARAHLRIRTRISEILQSGMPMLSGCRELAVVLCTELDWDYAGVWTVDLASWTLRCRDTWVREGQNLLWFEDASRAAALKPGAGLPGRAWMTARPQWATDLDLETEVTSRAQMKILPPSAARAGLRTALAFPLKYGDDVLAVVDLFSRERRPPDAQLLELLDAVGDKLALWELRERAEKCALVAQAEADEARAHLESVLDCAPVFVTVIGADETIHFVNRTLPHIRKEDIIGKPWRDFVLPDQRDRVASSICAVMRTGCLESYEIAMVEPDGSRKWLLNHVGPIRKGGTITGVIVIAQDVTEAKLGQLELTEAQRLASVGTLAAGVAHEINTPVQFVNDSVHFLREGSNDLFLLVQQLLALKRRAAAGMPLAEMLSEADEAVVAADFDYLLRNMPKAFDRAAEGLERVTAIVRSMKEFAHPAQKEMGPVDLNRAAQATLTISRNEYKYVADVETQFGELPLVTCHANDINQVILNIVVNAAHAIADVVRGTEKRGLIRLTTHRDDEDVVISISDTGGGIPEVIRDRIFDPFFTTKEVGKGTGQGLAIARAAIREKHGGELSFHTELGKGTTFIIRLPIGGRRSVAT